MRARHRGRDGAGIGCDGGAWTYLGCGGYVDAEYAFVSVYWVAQVVVVPTVAIRHQRALAARSCGLAVAAL